jgi:hypothetical protein
MPSPAISWRICAGPSPHDLGNWGWEFPAPPTCQWTVAAKWFRCSFPHLRIMMATARTGVGKVVETDASGPDYGS